jgi:hypothetical protein
MRYGQGLGVMKGFFGLPQNDKRWELLRELMFVGLIYFYFKNHIQTCKSSIYIELACRKNRHNRQRGKRHRDDEFSSRKFIPQIAFRNIPIGKKHDKNGCSESEVIYRKIDESPD